MKSAVRKPVLTLTALAAIALAPLASSHMDEKEIFQSYRQSYFTLLATNFGPMAAMVKGEMPWDQDQMEGFAEDFESITELNLMRGFPDGSDKGTTRAKPDIWKNKADFESKFADLQSAASELEDAVESGDRKAIAEKVGAAGKACKACHDDYKAKDYLY